jgi:hypothetical protein
MNAGEQMKERARLRALMNPVEKNADELAFRAAQKAQRLENERKAADAVRAAQKGELKAAAAAAAKATTPLSKEEKKRAAQEAAAAKRKQK